MFLALLLSACKAGIIIEANSKYIADPKFSSKINKCLELLSKKAPSAFGILTNHIGKIRAFSKSGTSVNLKPKTIDIAKTTFDASESWLASVLAHESIHAKQSAENRDYSGVAAEQECNAHQIEVLRLIGAPQSEIAYMLTLTGNHFDLNGDGIYDRKDYELRNW